jgi:two-component system, NarL family, nitrate/nitrite response regulator NarL
VCRLTFVTAIVSARALLREGLGRILCAAEFEITAAASSLEDAMVGLSNEDRPILLILDLTDDQPQMVEQIKRFKARHPTARVALLAERPLLSDGNLIAAFRCGADAYFLRPDAETLVKSLELVMLGETILPPEFMSVFLNYYDRAIDQDEDGETLVQPQQARLTIASNESAPRLSSREDCILRDLIEGHSNKMIARRNDIAEATVKVHVKAILRKIRVSNRTQAAIWGLNHRSYTGFAHEKSDSPLRSISNLPNFVDLAEMKGQLAARA